MAKKKKAAKKAHWSERDPRMANACEEAREFVRKFKTKLAAWQAITNPDWLEWYLEGPDGVAPHARQPVVQALADSKLLTEAEQLFYIRLLVPDPDKGWKKRG